MIKTIKIWPILCGLILGNNVLASEDQSNDEKQLEIIASASKGQCDIGEVKLKQSNVGYKVLVKADELPQMISVSGKRPMIRANCTLRLKLATAANQKVVQISSKLGYFYRANPSTNSRLTSSVQLNNRPKVRQTIPNKVAELPNGEDWKAGYKKASASDTLTAEDTSPLCGVENSVSLGYVASIVDGSANNEPSQIAIFFPEHLVSNQKWVELGQITLATCSEVDEDLDLENE